MTEIYKCCKFTYFYVVLFLKTHSEPRKTSKTWTVACSYFTSKKMPFPPTFRTVDSSPHPSSSLGGGNSNILKILPIFYFTPFFGEDEPILTNIFFKWVGHQPPTRIWTVLRRRFPWICDGQPDRVSETLPCGHNKPPGRHWLDWKWFNFHKKWTVTCGCRCLICLGTCFGGQVWWKFFILRSMFGLFSLGAILAPTTIKAQTIFSWVGSIRMLFTWSS